METESLSYKTLRNSSYFFVGYILPIAFSIFITPFVVHRLGVLQYGIFILVNTVNSFLGFVDLGLSTALTKFSAEYHAVKNFSQLERLLQSSMSLSYLFGSIGLVVFFCIGKWLLPYFHVSQQIIPNMLLVFFLAGVLFFLNSVLMPMLSMTAALQRYDVITKINIGNLVVTNILTVLVLLFGFQLKAIMAVNVFVLLLVMIAYRIAAGRILPEVSLRFSWYPEEIKKAYRFGLQTFVSNLASSALIYFDRLLIPIFLGPSLLSFYSLPGNVAIRTSGVTNSLSAMLFPMASALQGTGEMEKLKSIYIRAFRNLSVVSAAITTAVTLFAYKILYFWLGKEFADRGTGILIILTFTYYLVGLYIPLQSMLLGLGKVKFLIRQSLFMAAINILLLLILIPPFGITGAAWAYLIAVIPMIYAFWWVEHKYFELHGRLADYLKLYANMLVTSAATVVIVKFAVLPWVRSVYLLVLAGPFSVVLYFLLYYLFGFANTEDVKTFKSFLSHFIFPKYAKIT